MLRAFIRFSLVVGIASCGVRTPTPHGEVGREVALRVCALQDQCDCSAGALISDCQERVEREFAEDERKALDAGLVFSRSCLDGWLEWLDALGTCERSYPEHEPLCPIYGNDHDVGEACELFDVSPMMYGCRPDLSCIDGSCTDFANRPRLPEGAICSVDQHIVPTGDLGECAEGLQCDSADTRTCIRVPASPKAPLGEECSSPFGCEDDGICRPQADDVEPTDERPGTCVERTPPGEPCTLVYECDRICEDGLCQVTPVAACEVSTGWSALLGVGVDPPG